MLPVCMIERDVTMFMNGSETINRKSQITHMLTDINVLNTSP
jgi:hypothetical protein